MYVCVCVCVYRDCRVVLLDAEVDCVKVLQCAIQLIHQHIHLRLALKNTVHIRLHACMVEIENLQMKSIQREACHTKRSFPCPQCAILVDVPGALVEKNRKEHGCEHQRGDV